MSQAEVWSVGRLLQWTADYLKKHGADSPRLDAEVLLAHVLNCQRIELYTSFERVPDEAVRTAFRELVRRRASGEPVAYLVGRREFYSLSFQVSRDVLIPRPETELLVVTLLDLAKGRPGKPLAVCDVGTGSGILAVCVAKFLDCRVTAVDVSPAALDVARANAEAHGVAARIDFVCGDLLTALPPGVVFDFILSNPPYVSDSEFQGLAPTVRDFEPRTALVAGPQGTEVIARLIPQAADRLSGGGHLLLEISPMVHEAVVALLRAEPRFDSGPTIKDLARHPRVAQAKRKG
jgi:release factor glutamine methyltransferase